MGFNGGSGKNCWCCVAMCCNVLPCDALCCSVLHCHFECVAVLLVGLSRQAESGKNSSQMNSLRIDVLLIKCSMRNEFIVNNTSMRNEQYSMCKRTLKRDYILQKRPIIYSMRNEFSIQCAMNSLSITRQYAMNSIVCAKEPLKRDYILQKRPIIYSKRNEFSIQCTMNSLSITRQCAMNALLNSLLSIHCALAYYLSSIMGWLRLVGSLKLQVSFAKESHKRDYILHKRPKSLRSLRIAATPYDAVPPRTHNLSSTFRALRSCVIRHW